jgi:hypothetical protein
VAKLADQTPMTIVAPTVSIPHAILASPFMRHGGFAVYQGLPDWPTVGRLYAEAAERYPTATVQECRDDDLEDTRGGMPRRSLLTAEAGPAQDAMYMAPWLAELLSAACGVPIVPSGSRGSYSYYARPGDFLDLHRDVETCDVAMITGLHDDSTASELGGALVLYPGRVHEPLSAIRARPTDGAHPVKLGVGQTIVMFGGVVPHRVLPVRAGQVRIISVLCFQALIGE